MPGMAHVPVLVMSAMSEADERAKAMGADGFLVKPFDPDGLVNALDLVLASARAPRSRRHHAAPRTTRHDSQR
jgi:DNA-binding response OmpR family regulator